MATSVAESSSLDHPSFHEHSLDPRLDLKQDEKIKRPEDLWLHTFKKQGPIPHYKKAENIPARPGSPTHPSLNRSSSPQKEFIPHRAFQPTNGLKRPYELDLVKIENLSLPPFLTDHRLLTVDDLKCQFRISWFDAEKGCFFGKTWICPNELSLLEHHTTSISNNSPRKSTTQSNPKSVKIRSSQVKAKKTKRGKKKGTSIITDSNKSPESCSSEDTESETDDSESDSEESEESQEESEQDTQDAPHDTKFEDEPSSQVRRTAHLGKYFVGHQMNAALKAQNAFMHTTTSNPFLIIVIEVVVILEESGKDAQAPKKQDFISIGWTYFYPFNLEKNGLDVDAIWEDEDNQTYDPDLEKSKMLPLFQGTPRVLPFVAPQLMGASMNISSLSPVPGAMLLYKFYPKPEVRSSCFLWPEMAFIGSGDKIPGLDLSRGKLSGPYVTETATVSKIHVSLYPTIRKFEEPMLSKISRTYYESHPNAIQPDEFGNYPNAEIIERRIQIGFHNGHTFLHTPIVTTLQPAFDDEIGDGFDLFFHGILELEKYLRNEPGIALVFIVEYKVCILTHQPASPKKTGLSAILEKMGGAHSYETNNVDVERDVCMGWGVWSPSQDFDSQQPITIKLNFDEFGPNINGSYTYYPPCLLEATDDETASELSDDSDNPSATKLNPVIVSFVFGDRKHPLPEVTTRIVEVEKSSKKIMTIDEATSPIAQSIEDIEPQHQAVHVAEPKMEEEVEQELTPIPMFKEPIQPMPFMRPKKVLSRTEKARLLAAGFEPVLDSQGHLVNSLTMGPMDREKLRVDMELERKDKLKVNSISILFMGLTWKHDSHYDAVPSSVYFTFQFFNFPYATTERMHIYTGALPPMGRSDQAIHHHRSSSVPNPLHSRHWSHQSASNMATSHLDKGELLWPGILYKLEQDDSPSYDRPPGLNITFDIDSNTDDEMEQHFIEYLHTNSLHVDVWDGESLLYLGSCSVPLKAALRQGKRGVAFEEDVDVVMEQFSEYNGGRMTTSGSNSSGLNAQATSPIPTSTSTAKLHVRLANIGSESEKPDQLARQGPGQCILYDYHSMLKGRPPTMTDAHRMPEVDSELNDLLNATYQERIKDRNKLGHSQQEQFAQDSDKKRNMIKRLKNKENLTELGQIKNTPIYSYQMTRQERQRDLQTMEIYRERKKQGVVQKALKDQITTTYTIQASFGRAYYFEFFFTNPLGKEQNFEISWDDKELRLVLNAAEWKYLRRVHQVRLGVEDKLIHTRPDGVAELFMLPNETVAIPFVYQSFLAGYVTPSTTHQDVLGMMQGNGIPEETIQARTIQVSFLNNKKVPAAMLDVKINPRNYYVHRVSRMFRPENEMIRRAIRFSHMIESKPDSCTVFDSTHPHRKYLRCNKEDVVCSLNESVTNAHWKEMSFKLRVSGAPETQAVYFLLYDDPYHTSLSEIWRVLVHSLYRVDVNCILGQTNTTSLVLRGSAFSRNVQCYTDHPEELMIMTPAPFSLTANSLNEINLIMRPHTLNTTDMILNIVDVQMKSLVSSWLVVQHATTPSVTKSFELTIPKGKHINKRVSYTNPYSHRKSFYLKTNHPSLLQFKDELLDMQAGATQYIGLKFAPITHLASVEILIFLNDETDKIEECLAVKIIYV